MAFLCGSSSAALALADSRSKENVLLISANEQLMLAKSQLESEVQRLESEVQRLVQMDKPMTIEELDTNNKDERIAALEKKIEELDDTYSLGWAETSQTNADLTKENEELRQILARAHLEKVSGDEVVERNVAAMEETIESMQAEIYELHYFLGSKGYKARMLHAEGIRIPDEDAHAWWGFSACTRRNEDGTYSFFAHPDEEKTRPASMVNPNYGKQIRRYIRTYWEK